MGMGPGNVGVAVVGMVGVETARMGDGAGLLGLGMGPGNVGVAVVGRVGVGTARMGDTAGLLG